MRLTSFLVLLLLPTSAALARRTSQGGIPMMASTCAATLSWATCTRGHRRVDLVVKGGAELAQPGAGLHRAEQLHPLRETVRRLGISPTSAWATPPTRATRTRRRERHLRGGWVGAAHYIMPANVYFSGAVVANQLQRLARGHPRGRVEAGVGLHLGVGRE